MAKSNLRSRRSFELGSRSSMMFVALAMLAPIWIALIPSVLHANTITVNTTGDPGPSGTCDLRDAITNANNEDQSGSTNCVAGSGTDTIVFSVSGTITLDSGGTLPAIQNALTIDGRGKAITVSGASLYGVLVVDVDATLNLYNLTISDGDSMYQGAIFNNGTLTVTNSTFSDNAGGDGGAINNEDMLTVTNSTFYENSATDQGGAIFSEGMLTVTNSTFYDNSAPTGLYDQGGGIFNAATATVANSILADSTGGNCIGDTITDGGYNISDDDTCGFTGTGANGKPIGDNVSDAHIKLGSLTNNGGPTETIALGTGSYAIDAIPIALCPATDQRGAPRPDPGSPLETACDIGAFESGYADNVWISPPTINFGTVALGETSAPITVTITNGSGKTLELIEWSLGPDFKIASTTCPEPPSYLPADESCSITIVFHPLSLGSKNELLQVHNSSLANPLTVHLRGTASRSGPC